jgi:hypothetical protein
MRRSWAFLALMGIALAAAPAARADDWDTTTNNDNDFSTTKNELTHGTIQNHDFAGNGGSDDDWYHIRSASRSSYEVLSDGWTGDFNYASVYRYASNGTTFISGTYANVGTGDATSLRWMEDSTAENQFIQVLPYPNGGHSTNDDYTIRSYETTYGIPRFNNSGTQTTVLQIQNPSENTVNVQIHFYNGSGTFLGTSSAAIAPRALLGVATASLGFAAGQSGSITVSNDGRYGTLTGKAVALEPSTGFTFDTLMVPIPH